MKTFIASFARLMGAIQTGIGVFHLRITIGLLPPMVVAVVVAAALYWDAFVAYKPRALWHELARGYLAPLAIVTGLYALLSTPESWPAAVALAGQQLTALFQECPLWLWVAAAAFGAFRAHLVRPNPKSTLYR